MTNTYNPQTDNHGRKRFLTGLVLVATGMCLCRVATAVQTKINLGTAGNFVILAKSGISTIPTSAVTGDIGVSPIDSTAITGFALNLAAGSPFATSAQITGKGSRSQPWRAEVGKIN
jgi:Ice-binding-like